MRRLRSEFFSECGDIDPVFLFIDIRIFELNEPFGRNASDALVIARIAPLLGLEPRFELPPSDKLILASAHESR
jgi:hypothetical protein